MAKVEKEKVKVEKVKKVAKPVEVIVEPAVEVVVEKKTATHIGGKAIVRTFTLDNGNISILTVDGVGYTLPPSEYDLLLN